MNKKNIYKNYSKLAKKAKQIGIPQVEMPHLLVMQIGSFEEFLQAKIHPGKRSDFGLQRVFDEIFPIEDAKGIYHLEFEDYKILKEKYTELECIERNLTYEAPIKGKLKLTVYDPEVLRREGEKRVQNIIEQEVYFGEIPLITSKGTFIINGSEHVIISQLKRSPGVFFSSSVHKTGKRIYNAKVVPYNGSWLQFNLDIRDTLFVNIDRRRKIPFTILLRVFGIETDNDIRNTFLEKETIKIENSAGRFLFSDVFDQENGELVEEAGTEITEELIEVFKNAAVENVEVTKEEFETHRKIIENTLKKDPTSNGEEALKKIYNLIRPGEEPTLEIARDLFERMFEDIKRYDLKEVGRYKLNSRLDLDLPEDQYTLTKEDFVAIIKTQINIVVGKDKVDDIDNLANRRIRTIAELLEEQYSIGLRRMARIAIERMSVAKAEEVTIHDLINSNALDGVVKSFFLVGQLSQYMEQTNPLAALTHKRRFSAVGPGGLTRERAGLDVRDVHYTHYGRICPIETPEGPNIGLITSPAIYSRVNELGFIETPYIKVNNGVISDEVHYLDASKEEKYTIAPANINYTDDKKIDQKFVFARRRGEYVQVIPEDVDYMDVSPNQITSVSASLIPFIEHDDANRALMGANMQRQAVPLLINESPVVGTGVEKIVAEDSGVLEKAPYAGTVVNVTSEYVDIEKDDDKRTLDFKNTNRIYLKKYLKTNQDTTFNQRPIVKVGDKVKKGDILTDGPNVDDGRLSLGKNLLVAFMSWYGYNYEDAIILNEKLARDDVMTSIHIQEEEVMVRTVKNGKEELAYDIPNVPVKALRNLDKTGIIRVGSNIESGDIIVGKITPKNVEVEPSAEENLMRALFGDRAGDFTNTSLKAKPGMEGVVIDVKVFSKREKSFKDDEEVKQDIILLKKERQERDKKIKAFLAAKLSDLLVGQTAKNIIDAKNNNYYIQAGAKITKKDLNKINFNRLDLTYELVQNESLNQKIYDEVILKVKNAEQESKNIYKKAVDRLKHGDELPNGVLKMVKVYIAKKRKIKVGDKIAGRHGNKGVISKVAPVEDMPFLEDGTSVDVILNTLGVPSRMNIGQIMETHLGMAAMTLGFKTETPVFDGATMDDIVKELENAGLPKDGKQKVYDGKTGEPFKERVTIGYMYILKLHHLADDKMHARSTGPYSLITQQPLGGKAQHGGQRLGEMEVWALEAYGASKLLEEMLTIKSDDVDGRTKTFKAITKGENPPEFGIPESFNVLVSELKSLAFDIEFVNDEKEDELEDEDFLSDDFEF